MATFLPLPPQGPVPPARPVAPQVVNPVTPPATLLPAGGQQGYGHNMTLAALVARQKDIADRQGQVMQQGATNIPQGLAQMAWSLVNALGERRAAKAEEEGNVELGEAFKSYDPATGQLAPDAMATVMRRAPDVGIDLYKSAMAARLAAGKLDNWVSIPTPQGETGQWFKNLTNNEEKKIGGSTENTAWKPSDIGSLRDDYTKAATVYTTAAPSWESMKDAAKTAIGHTGPNVGSADLNMVVGLAKILDPTSVVREGESESVKKTGGAADYLVSYYNQLVQGGQLTDDIRRGIMNTGQSRMGAYHKQAKEMHDWISGIATRHNVPPEDVVPPLAEFSPYAEESATPKVVKQERQADGSIVFTFEDGTTMTSHGGP
jgi:hypothetical protein